jgi:Uma2 family endonuclease
MLLDTKLYTVEEFEAFMTQPENHDRNFELIHGEIVEKSMPTELHGVITGRIFGEIYIHLKQHPGGRLGPEIRNRMPDDNHNSRQPDISYYADDSRPIVERGAVPQMPDLAIEVKSPDDTYKEMREKADYYLANGARMVILVLTERRTLEVHQPGKLEILTIDDTLDGGDVLPGFRLAVKDIFPE